MNLSNLKYEKNKIIIAACVLGFFALAYVCFTTPDPISGEKIREQQQETEEEPEDITAQAYRKAIRLRHSAALDPGRGTLEDLEEQRENREEDNMFRGVPDAVTFFEIAEQKPETDGGVKIYDDDFLDVYGNLPPRPDTQNSPDTVLGWDTDRDGVRDDVQQTITLKWYKPEYELLRMALLQLARDYQLAMYDFREGNEKAVAADSIRVLEDQKCVIDVLAYINERNANNFRAINEVNAVESSQFDTANRVNIYTELYARLPIDAQDRVMKQAGNFCEFPLGDIPSRRNKNEFRIAGNRAWNARKKTETKKSDSPDDDGISGFMNFSVSAD